MNSLKFSLLLAFLCPCLLFAQTTVSGVVQDAEGNPLPGATVKFKDTTTGTTTASDGSYSLQVPEDKEILVFTFLGYKAVEENISDRTIINVEMAEENRLLDEVVVVGFGSQSRRRLTSSVASVGKEAFENSPVTDFQNGLQGRMAGVVMTNSSGSSNSASSIRIRGVGSISASNQPIIVVDGLILSNRTDAAHHSYFGFATNPLINLNPNDIESVEVLKDAAATAIYGSRGSNGVVLITTKSGNYNAKPKVSIGYWAGVTGPSNTYDLLNGPEYAASLNQSALNAGYNPAEDPEFFLDVKAQPSTDWVDLLTRTGFDQEFNANVSGGTRTTNYYVSGTVRDEKGYLLNTDFQRYSMRANIDQMLGKRFTLNISLAPSRVTNSRMSDWETPFYSAGYAAPNLKAFDENGRSFGYLESGAIQGSPYTNLTETSSSNTSNQLLTNTSLAFSPTANLSLKTAFSAEISELEELYKYGARTLNGFFYGNGLGISFNQSTLNYNWTNLATWKNAFNRHDLEVTAGFNLTREKRNSQYLEGVNYPDDRIIQLGGASEIITNQSNRQEAAFSGILGRIQYAFDNKYLLNLSMRYDGSSRFGENNRNGFFPALSAGWILSDEPFLKANWLSFLKLRTSFGISGNAEIADFASLGLIRFGQNYNGTPGYDLQSLSNTDLGWEKNVQWDLGLDFSIMQDRIKGSLGYYIKDTKDLLLAAPIPATTGFETLFKNIGEVRNQGFEFELSADILNGPFSWSLMLNGATLKNEVRKLVDANGDGVDDDIYTEGRFLFRPGYSIGTYYLPEFAGVDPDNGDALFWNAEGTEKLTNVSSDANRRFVGKSIPVITGGITSTFGYKNFDLTAFVQYKLGYQVYMADGSLLLGASDGTNKIKSAAENVWTTENRYTDVPQNRMGQINGQQRSSRNLHDADHWRIRNVTLGYNFKPMGPNKVGLRIFASGQNLWTITQYPGLDPDAEFFAADQAEQGYILSPPPAKRSWTLGFNLNF